MKIRFVLFTCCFFMMFCTVSYGWEGRTAGMGGVAGLVEDESDFLIHPALIAGGKGVNFYGSMQYKQMYTDKYSYSVTYYDVGYPDDWSAVDSNGTGREPNYSVLTGVAFPAGPGRLGIFFGYMGLDGKLRGSQDESSNYGSPWSMPWEQDKKADNFALRFLYGIPIGNNLKAGAEFQIAHRKEKNETSLEDPGYYIYTNAVFGFYDESYSLLHLGVPYDSRYYEASLKASIEGTMGPAKAAFTLRGGMPFSSKNTYDYGINDLGAGTWGAGHNTGKVKGYNVGADAWVRVPLNGSVVLPFLASVDMKQIKRNTAGPELGTWSGYMSQHNNKEKSLAVTAGGGVDYTPAQGTKVAGGLYYSYLRQQTDFTYLDHYLYNPPDAWRAFNHGGYPKTTEHRLTFKAAAEKAISSTLTLNGGFNLFYGRMNQKYNYDYSDTTSYNTEAFTASVKGDHWGAGASFGVALKAGDTMLEPYITGGIERVKLSGDGVLTEDTALDSIYPSIKLKKKIGFIGVGLTLRY